MAVTDARMDKRGTYLYILKVETATTEFLHEPDVEYIVIR